MKNRTRARLEHGDMRKVLKRLIREKVKVHAICTDPPYHLTSIVKRFGKKGAAPAKSTKTGAFARASRGFMGLKWDGGNVAFDPETWRLCYDLLPPGGYLIAFGGTRTYHRLACAIEDAGFEIRDAVLWLYGSGFPKSHNIGKAIDRKAGATRKVVGKKTGRQATPTQDFRGGKFAGGRGKNSTIDTSAITAPATPAAAEWEGWGTALKPAAEVICLARKPVDGTVAANVLKHRVGALNIDACRIEGEAQRPRGVATGLASKKFFSNGAAALVDKQPHDLGRWPANVVHDGSDEVVRAFPDTAGGAFPSARGKGGIATQGHRGQANLEERRLEAGTAARFFYSAKAGAADRLESKHPTVKTVSLMRWLVRLVTPPGGTVLDPFAGSGTTLMACMAEGFDSIMVEKRPGYLADIRRRVKHVKGEDTPLFGGELESAAPALPFDKAAD